jgi:hypothetical protein
MKRFLKRSVIALVTTVLTLSLYTCVAQAAEDEHTVAVTVEDITAVSEQLSDMDEEINMLARLVYTEARGVDSMMEQAAVMWCVLNRVDAEYGTIERVVTARYQFAYSSRTNVTDEFQALAKDVLTRWLLEKRGIDDVGRVLPSDYLWFAGRNGHNRFRDAYRRGNYWDWDCINPYESEDA